MNDFDPTVIHAKLVAAGDEWAEKEAAASILEESRRSVLSQLKLKSDQPSDAGRETEALADPEYREHLTLMVEARKEANRAKVKYESAKMWVELERTKAANLRAEMRLT